MRTKTLLLSAAALVAGIATSQAQVYSQNVVGYATIPLNTGNLTLIAPTLDVDGTGTNGTIQTVLGTNCAENTVVEAFNGVGFDLLSYAPIGRGNTTPQWQLLGAAASTYPLNVGQGFWIIDPSDTGVTVVGNVLQGSLTNKYLPAQGGLGLISDQVPVSGGITSVLGYTPTENDVAEIYNGTGFDLYSYAPIGRGNTTPQWQLLGAASEPQISVGEGFWIIPAATTPSWNQTFTVN